MIEDARKELFSVMKENVINLFSYEKYLDEIKELDRQVIDEILKRITANEIIGIETPMDIQSREHMVENNTEIAYLVGGVKGMTKIQNTLKERYNKYEGIYR
jgi:hypothetical protein